MFVMHNEEAIFTAQTEKNSTIFKKTAVRGNIQQTIKQQNGNFINYDYELIHDMDLWHFFHKNKKGLFLS